MTTDRTRSMIQATRDLFAAGRWLQPGNDEYAEWNEDGDHVQLCAVAALRVAASGIPIAGEFANASTAADSVMVAQVIEAAEHPSWGDDPAEAPEFYREGLIDLLLASVAGAVDSNGGFLMTRAELDDLTTDELEGRVVAWNDRQEDPSALLMALDDVLAVSLV